MTHKNFETKKIRSFDKSFDSIVSYQIPEKYKELENLNLNSAIASGSNLSYPALGLSKNSSSIFMKKFNRILNFDKKANEVTVESGIKISELLNFLLPHGLWIPQLPGYPFISLGGAVATNAHGKSCGLHGAIRKSVKEILLFHSTNGWLKLSEKSNKEIFDLTIGGLGLTGIIVNIKLDLSKFNSNKFDTYINKVNSVDETISILKNNSISENYIYSWNRADSFKNFGEGFVFENKFKSNENNLTKISTKENSFIKLNKLNPINLWNPFTIKLANFSFQILNSLREKKSEEDFSKVIFPFLGKENYFYFFGKNGFIESQLLIDKNILNEFLDEFKFLFKKMLPIITLFSIKNMSGEQKLLRFEDNKFCLTFDYVNNKKNREFMHKVDRLCVKYKILPSVIKDSRISKEIFNFCYPEADLFRDKLRNFDKKRIYKSHLSERLEL